MYTQQEKTQNDGLDVVQTAGLVVVEDRPSHFPFRRLEPNRLQWISLPLDPPLRQGHRRFTLATTTGSDLHAAVESEATVCKVQAA
jgi:hypothetical protein